LGWLFKYQTQSQQKTNLLVFLTPRVLKKSADASSLDQEKEARFDALQKSEIQTQKTPPGQ
jgi:type II secretory pathway component GspD/PulD (secretin)